MDAIALGLAAATGSLAAQQETVVRGWRPLVPEGRQQSYERSKYAPATQAGELVFLSGVIGVARGEDNGPTAQFERAFERLTSLLADLDLAIEDVLEMTTYHVNLGAYRREFLAVKDDYISEPYPSWTAIGVDRLWLDQALIEIRVIAVRPPHADTE